MYGYNFNLFAEPVIRAKMELILYKINVEVIVNKTMFIIIITQHLFFFVLKRLYTFFENLSAKFLKSEHVRRFQKIYLSHYKLAERTFYFINDNEMYAVNYSISTINGTIKLGDILEARYDHTGKIENVILYNDSQINWYDKYYYKDGKIDKCEEFEWFLYDKPVSYITDKVTDDGIFYGDKNPMLVFTHNYIYEKDIVTEIEIITCNLEQIDITKVKAKSAEYKKLKKDKII